MRENVSLDEAVSILEEALRPLASREERLSLGRALLRVASRPILSPFNVPHYTASAVDGFAVRSADLLGASPSSPRRLSPDLFRFVNTGDPLPKGFDAVVPVEAVRLDGDGWGRFYASTSPFENVRGVGCEVCLGDVLVQPGDVLNPEVLSLLRSVGVEEVFVRALPRVGFLPTGSELSSRFPPESGKVMESNSLMVRGYCALVGLPLLEHPLVPDEEGAVEGALKDLLRFGCDLILTSGGTARGKRDLTVELVGRMGGLLFRGVRMRPSRPLSLGWAEVGERRGLVLCLPGYPASFGVALWVFLHRALLELGFFGDRPELELRRVEAKLALPVSSKPGIDHFARGFLAQVRGHLLCYPTKSGSAVLRSLAHGDGLLHMGPDEVEGLQGSEVSFLVLPFRRSSWRRRLVFAGSNDPFLNALLSRFKEESGVDVAVLELGSMGGLRTLRDGCAHLCGTHLFDPRTKTFNTPYMEDVLGDLSGYRRLPLFLREQGLLVRKGNPLGVRGVEDLVREGVSFVNRQRGSGTRVMLDHLLEERGIDPSRVVGYSREESSHVAVAAAVAAGEAYCGLGARAVASPFGLDFVPLFEELYELICREEDLEGDLLELWSFLERASRGEVLEPMEGYRWVSSWMGSTGP